MPEPLLTWEPVSNGWKAQRGDFAAYAEAPEGTPARWRWLVQWWRDGVLQAEETFDTPDECRTWAERQAVFYRARVLAEAEVWR